MLRQRRGVHVGIETDRAGKLRRQFPDDIDVAPCGLRRLVDEAVPRGRAVEHQGAKRGEADGAKRPERSTLVAEELAHPRQRRVRIRGRNSRLGVERAVLVADSAHKFGAAGLDGAEQSGFAAHRFPPRVRSSIAYPKAAIMTAPIDSERPS